MNQVKRILFIAPASLITPYFPEMKEAGIEVGLAENMKAVTPFLRKEVTAIFARPQLSGFSAVDLLEVSKDDPNFPPIYIIAEQPNSEEAEYLLSLGAKDYWADPLNLDKINLVLQQQRNAYGQGKQDKAQADAENLTRVVGSNPAIQRVLQLAKQVAKSKASVLISGESGTGKEMFAKTLHAWSDRANMPFIAVNCAALPEHLLESELFGHEKGAFTGAIARKPGKFELANGGTLLLDEISEMDPALQAKLLRVLQEGEVDRVGGTETVKVDVRVLATTNRNMEGWIEEGKFRQDLYFRLNVIPLRLPSLCERGADILELAQFFAKKYTAEYQLPAAQFSKEAIDWLMSYAFPGNVRELQNLMERAVLLANGQPITPSFFLLEGDEWPIFAEQESAIDELSAQQAEEMNARQKQLEEQMLSGTSAPLQDVQSATNVEESGDASSSPNASSHNFTNAVIPLHEMERIMIMKGLEATQGNRTQAAELLGISVRTLRNKLSEYKEAGLTS